MHTDQFNMEFSHVNTFSQEIKRISDEIKDTAAEAMQVLHNSDPQRKANLEAKLIELNSRMKSVRANWVAEQKKYLRMAGKQLGELPP